MNEAIKEMIANRTVLWGVVTRIGKAAEDIAYMEVPVASGITGTIMASEADGDFNRQTLHPLLGVKIPFVVIEEKDGKLFCSRKAAQAKLREDCKQALLNHEVLHGIVVGCAPYGVYIDVGGVSGLLKNGDYINAATPVSDYLPKGTKVDVICKDIAPNGKIQWEPVEKPEVKAVEYDVKVDTCVIGKVINMKPFATGGTGVFVRIEQGLDVLCLHPADMELAPGDTVTVKIASIDPPAGIGQPPRVKGRLLRVL